MKTLYESLLGNVKGGVEGEIREWFNKQKQSHEIGDFEIEANKHGYNINLIDWTYSPYLGCIYVYDNLPNKLTGIYVVRYFNNKKLKESKWSKIVLDRCKLKQLDLSNLYVSAKPDGLTDVFSIHYSNIGKLTGLPVKDYSGDTKMYIELRQSFINNIENIKSPDAVLKVYDGTILNLDNVKNCEFHEMIIGGITLSHTLAERRLADSVYNKYLIDNPENLKPYVWQHNNWCLCKPYSDILDDFDKNNKLNIIQLWDPDYTPKCMSYRLERKPYGWILKNYKSTIKD